MGESRIPRIQEHAPDFEAKSTHGPIRLSDYTSKGRWVMLFSHPADFTPVCSTEFIELARRYEEFEKLGVQLIGVSVDSVFSHIAWIRDLEQIGEVQVRFPVVADVDQRVSQAYGLIHDVASDTATVRSVFAIDPKGHIRAILYYPMQLGRNVEELIRVFQGLQTSDAYDVSCPANWASGDPVMLSAPATTDEATKRTGGSSSTTGVDVKSWYMARRDLAVPLKK
jgi:peroxiredoxin (alkyl hydroperoxide reductase subunit C)